jgi:hypothetical protein
VTLFEVTVAVADPRLEVVLVVNMLTLLVIISPVDEVASA